MSATSESGTQRLRLDLGYDGTDFSGWATQPGLRTVQGEVERAITVVGRLHDRPVTLTCAGRTDAGVHARGQVAHVDLAPRAAEAVTPRRLNALLPGDVRVRRVALAPPGFDARFAAASRRYTYRLADTEAGLDPLRRHEILGWRHRLDEAAMDTAGRELLGLHDFAAFCKAREGATTIRTLLSIGCRRTAAGIIEVELSADAFCHSMVRALVGALVAVGESRRSPGWPAEVLAAKKRDPGVRVMPPGGLTLEQVVYPRDDELATRAAGARALAGTAVTSGEHYFSEEPAIASSPVTARMQVWGRSMELSTDAGVFARGRLDPGTAVLFRHAEPPTVPGTYLDLGCGYGVIGCALALAVPTAVVWATDVNRRALRLTAANAATLGLTDQLHAATPDEVSAESFDAIWSNPPIHVGKAATHAILLRWLPKLRSGGTATMVVGRHLGADSLQRWLIEQGYPCERLGSAKGFRVLRARQPE